MYMSALRVRRYPTGLTWGALRRRYERARGLGAVDVTIDPTKQQAPWQKTLADLVQTGLSVYQAERLRKENLERIRAGKPPLTDAQMRSLAPTANVNVALPKELQYGMLAGGAALLYLLATRKR